MRSARSRSLSKAPSVPSMSASALVRVDSTVMDWTRRDATRGSVAASALAMSASTDALID